VLPFGSLWYAEPNAIPYAKFRGRSHNAVIRVYDEAGNLIDTHEHTGRFRRAVKNYLTYRVKVLTTVCTALLVPFTTLCPTFSAVCAVLFATFAAVWTGPA